MAPRRSGVYVEAMINTPFSPFKRRQGPRQRRFRAIPGAHAGAQSDHAAGAVRRADRDPPGGRRQARMGAGARSCSPRCSTASTAGSRGCSRAPRASAPSSTASPISSISASRPALILYFWGLHELKSAGWIAAMVFAICGRAAARPLQRHDRRSRTARPGRRIFSSACRRRPAPSPCCCRSTCISSASRSSPSCRR